MTITLRDLTSYGLGLATLPAIAGAILAVESAPARRLWAKRPLVINREFWGVRLPHRRAKLWCRRCDWTVTGNAAVTTPATREHCRAHEPRVRVNFG